jgi:hypothetical protein
MRDCPVWKDIPEKVKLMVQTLNQKQIKKKNLILLQKAPKKPQNRDFGRCRG